MTTRYQNLVGVLSWIASRDAEASQQLNNISNSASDILERVVAAIHLNTLATEAGVQKAKTDLAAECVEGRLVALGYTAANEENRPIPETAWIGASVDEVESTIGKPKSTWHGLHFQTADVKALWPPVPVQTRLPPRGRTGPAPKHREAIKGILEIHRRQVEKALERGEIPPPRPTSEEIAAKLSSASARVSDRTVRHNVDAILSGKD